MNVLVHDRGVDFYVGEEYPLEDLLRVQQRSLEMFDAIAAVLDRNGITYTAGFGTLLGTVRHSGFIPWDDDIDLFIPDAEYARAILALRAELPADLLLHNKRNDPVYWVTWVKVRDRYSDAQESMWKIDRKLKYHGLCVDLIRVGSTTAGRQTQGATIKELTRRRAELDSRRPRARGLLARITGLLRYRLDRTRVDFALRRAKAARAADGRKVLLAAPGTIIEAAFDHDDFFPVNTVGLAFEGRRVPVPHHPEKVLKALYGDYASLPPVESRQAHFDWVRFLERP